MYVTHFAALCSLRGVYVTVPLLTVVWLISVFSPWIMPSFQPSLELVGSKVSFSRFLKGSVTYMSLLEI